ncbi:hypothetical protein KC878_04345 [Candidatus Saccharibacteria bacterium]|nr:hypothetical protein [Candidatus Saccharibacteria bacterium]MCB9821430.1 hypothetical protein [Candidatus Nomurabacteria bacterium]
MDGDIKRGVKPIQRPKQRSETLVRRAAQVQKTRQAIDALPAPKKIASNKTTRGFRNKINPFEPPAGFRKPRRHHMWRAISGLAALFTFGALTFMLGYTFDHDHNSMIDADNTETTSQSGLPECEVVWDKTSASNSPNFELTFDRELPVSFSVQFTVEDVDTGIRSIIRPINGKYTLTATHPSAYMITVKQESDVATRAVLCSYGPVLLGFGSASSQKP